MPTIDSEIRSKIEAFADDIATLVKRAALDAVVTALATGKAASVDTTTRAPRRAAPAKAAKRSARAAAPAKASASRKHAAKRTPGAKRPPAELAKLTEKLGAYIKANPGRRMEAIGKALSTPTAELTLPIKKLLAAKKIRSEGQKRATEYFPA